MSSSLPRRRLPPALTRVCMFETLFWFRPAEMGCRIVSGFRAAATLLLKAP
jgi:hypothetical protein